MSNYIGRGIDQIDNVSTLDNLSFNGSDATFNLTQNSTAFTPVSADALQIQIDGIIQSGNYTVSGSTVTFDFTPSGSSVCNGIKHFGVGLLTTPTDGSVTQAKLGAEAVNESKMQISNAGTNGQYLQKQSGNTGGLTWADAGATADNYFASSGLSSKDLGTGLHIKTGDSGLGTAHTQCDDLVIESDGHTGMTITSPSANQCKINFADTDDNVGSISYNHNGDTMSFRADDTEMMTIHDQGVSIGCTNTSYSTLTQADDNGAIITDTNTSILATNQGVPLVLARTNGDNNNRDILNFNRNGSTCGQITGTNSSTTYATSSDYRLKENVNYDFDATTRLKQLKPARFNFIADETNTLVDGFLAHEVSSIVPEAITGEKDAVDENGDIKAQGIDQAKLVPLLTGALQEAITKIETLETKVTALENK